MSERDGLPPYGPPANSNTNLGISIDLPPAELRLKVQELLAIALISSKPPCVLPHLVKASDLSGVANFVLGGLLGMAQSSVRVN